jgi:uncharacterized protein YprB with RNaseH-like and TPR domain
MLENTFCHIPGVGPKTERQLWAANVRSWGEARECDPLPLSAGRARALGRNVEESIARLASGDIAYFCRHLASNEHWRLYPAFRHTTAYLDIETTGLRSPGDSITTIALYDGQGIFTYVQGENLDAFGEDIARYELIVTYNGKCFDVPFIRNDLGIPMAHAHIDLRYVLASLGYRGGLKGCERQLGVDRGGLEDVDGYIAVLLWRDFRRRGNQRARETLLAYNVLDVVNLETLMVLAHNLKLRDTPFAHSHRLPMPTTPRNPFQADRETIARLQRARFW